MLLSQIRQCQHTEIRIVALVVLSLIGRLQLGGHEEGVAC